MMSMYIVMWIAENVGTARKKSKYRKNLVNNEQEICCTCILKSCQYNQIKLQVHEKENSNLNYKYLSNLICFSNHQCKEYIMQLD